jgi:Tfp pilus assembly protein PilO
LSTFSGPTRNYWKKQGRSAKIIKTYDKELKTPYHRLLESALPREIKNELTAIRSAFNPVELQYNLNEAIDNLLSIHKAKVTFS